MASGPSMDLSSFTDIMTCVLGILVLIILLTGIDARWAHLPGASKNTTKKASSARK